MMDDKGNRTLPPKSNGCHWILSYIYIISSRRKNAEPQSKYLNQYGKLCFDLGYAPLAPSGLRPVRSKGLRFLKRKEILTGTEVSVYPWMKMSYLPQQKCTTKTKKSQ